MKSILRDHRCAQCRRLLFRGLLLAGSLEMKCPRCKTENIIRGIGGLPKQEGHYFIVYDYDGNIVDASASTTKILGYSKEELLRMHRGDLRSDVTPADYEVLRATILTGIGSPAFDTVHRRKDGAVLPVKLRVKVLTAEASRYALVIARVLDGMPSSATKRSDDRYEFSVNKKNQFLYVSNPLASRLGYRWIELIGKSLEEIMKPAVSKREREAFKRLLASERSFQLKDTKLLRRDGSSLKFDLSFHPHEDDYEGFEGYDIAGTVSET